MNNAGNKGLNGISALIDNQRREKCILAVEGDRHLAVIAGERSAIMLAAVGPDRTEAKAGLIKPVLLKA